MSKYFDILTKKSKTETQAEWAIVLDRISNDSAKPSVIDLMVQIFPLTKEEARDLAESTPIVLLDQLPLEVAEQIKKFFSVSNVSCTVTKDGLAKRKCFRAIWPEPPNLSAILSNTSMPVNSGFEQTGEAAAEEQPVSSFDHAADSFAPAETEHEELKNEEKDFSGREVIGSSENDQLKELTLELQQENEILRERLEKMKKEIRQEEETRFNREIQQAISERSKAEEVLRSLKEEKQGLEIRVEALQRQLDVSKEEITKAKQAAAHSETSHEVIHRLSSELKSAQEEAKQFRFEWSQTQKALSDARAEIEELKKMIEQSQAAVQHFKEDAARIRKEMEAKIQAGAAEASGWRRRVDELTAVNGEYQKEIDALKFQNRELLELKTKNQQLAQEHQQMAAQLEVVQKQNREFVRQLEQQELIQKRMRAASEIAEKENRLKELNQKCSSLNEDIRLREESVKEILSEQGLLEDEITKLRQSQKYMAEQAKLKDKNRLQRPRIVAPNLSSEENNHSEYSPEG